MTWNEDEYNNKWLAGTILRPLCVVHILFGVWTYKVVWGTTFFSKHGIFVSDRVCGIYHFLQPVPSHLCRRFSWLSYFRVPFSGWLPIRFQDCQSASLVIARDWPAVYQTPEGGEVFCQKVCLRKAAISGGFLKGLVTFRVWSWINLIPDSRWPHCGENLFINFVIFERAERAGRGQLWMIMNDLGEQRNSLRSPDWRGFRGYPANSKCD